MITAGLQRYRDVLAIGPVRDVLLLGILVRMPMAATGLVLTFHAVLTLHASWAMAGLLTTATTLAGALSAPLRGRLLDRQGLRRTVAPCLVVNVLVWSVAPFVGYWWLLGFALVAGFFMVPVFSIVRQAVVAETTQETRQAALSLDSVLVEIGFAVGPLIGTWLATSWSTRGAVIAIQAAGVAAGALIAVLDPRIVPDEDGPVAAVPRREWFTAGVLVILVATTAVTLILSATEVSAVAMLREWGRTPDTGWVMAVWAVGSMLGGLVYGSLHRGFHILTLLGLLAVVSLPAAWASGPLVLAPLVTLAGLACAPSIASSAASVAELVPAGALGEAMGWHGSALTLGSAVGAPVAGWVIDRWGGGSGFVVASACGLLVSVVGTLAVAGRRRARSTGPSTDPSADSLETSHLSSARDAVHLEPPALDPHPHDARRTDPGGSR